MRRLGLFAGFLLLLGLTTAVAASFDVRADDIGTFSTPVTIEVPGRTETYALRKPRAEVPGLLDTDLLSEQSSVHNKVIQPGTSLTSPAAANRFHSWETTALSADLVLYGPATLWIEKNQPTRAITAGLFACPAPAEGAPPVPTDSCDLLGAVTVAHPDSDDGGGAIEREVPFGQVEGTVDAGDLLRLQVANLGTGNFNIQWGYRENRQARLELTLASAP